MRYVMTLASIARDGSHIGPRTKKNHPVLVRGRSIVLPSPQYREWLAGCVRALRADGHIIMDGRRPRWTGLVIARPVNCAALIYRDRRVGDAVGYYQAIADALEHIGAVADDRYIVSWDGSRMLKDAHKPRVEICFTEA